MGTVHLISRGPAVKQCPRCALTVLAGLDEGLPYRVDPVPLNAAGELTARLSGRNAYVYIASKVTYRDVTRMKGDTKYGRPPVLADHACRAVAAEHVASEHVEKLSRMIAGYAAVREQKLIRDAYLDDEALFTVGRILNGKVISLESTPAPF